MRISIKMEMIKYTPFDSDENGFFLYVLLFKLAFIALQAA